MRQNKSVVVLDGEVLEQSDQTNQDWSAVEYAFAPILETNVAYRYNPVGAACPMFP